MWPAIIAAVGALGSAAAARSANRDARLSAQNQVDQQTALQREFAQHGIQWRVEDARRAGLHPLYALSGAGATYSPQPISVMPDMSAATAIQNFGTLASRFADQYFNDEASEPYGPPAWAAGDGAAPYAVPDRNFVPEIDLPPIDFGVPPPYGLVSHTGRASSQIWDVPKIGKLILPAASDFSQALEGLDSVLAQGLYLYINQEQLGAVAARGFQNLLASTFGESRALAAAKVAAQFAQRALRGELVSDLVKEYGR